LDWFGFVSQSYKQNKNKKQQRKNLRVLSLSHNLNLFAQSKLGNALRKLQRKYSPF